MDNLTVVHSNELIEASYNLSLDEVRLISFVASKIDSRKPNIGEIKIYPNQFAEAFGLDSHNMHRHLIHAIKSLANKSVTMRYDEHNNMVLPWLSVGIYARQPNENSHVIVEFSQRIEPYLFELKERFTAINFEYAVRLNTPFSFRLYQWLIKAKNLNKNKQGEAVVVELEIDWMKTQAGLNGDYERWGNFNDWVLKPAIEKINRNTDISVTWQPIRTGKKITAVRFIYALEKTTQSKPARPRLHRRPKVKAGSHEEGMWMRKNLALLLDYEAKLKAYDAEAKLNLPDLRKMAEYAAIAEPELQQRLKKEIEERTTKKAA
ncbi:replication initiation protein [Vibrio alginolyticus]|uniref:replication initiation protein n=2 Tax=Vibrio harveyi group TaxID=717610 RepID=UPI001BD66ED3|nr:replication initiation protein [Vibrio alginolyticus]MBT0036996.1 replication initiation protein [Vibrio alginolyticus]